jgi:hypothetical protein
LGCGSEREWLIFTVKVNFGESQLTVTVLLLFLDSFFFFFWLGVFAYFTVARKQIALAIEASTPVLIFIKEPKQSFIVVPWCFQINNAEKGHNNIRTATKQACISK